MGLIFIIFSSPPCNQGDDSMLVPWQFSKKAEWAIASEWTLWQNNNEKKGYSKDDNGPLDVLYLLAECNSFLII